MQPPSLIALYHAVDAGSYRDAVTRAALARQLRWLKAHYRVLPLAELLAERRRGRSLQGLAALTFDDNHRSVLEVALPLAAELELPATWFLIGGPLKGQPFWRELVRRIEAEGRIADFLAFARERHPAAGRLRPERFYRDSKDPARIDSPAMQALLRAYLPEAGPPAGFIAAEELAKLPPGVTLASHSESHPLLAGLPAEIQARELAAGLESLAALGHRSRILALPFGGPGSYDATTLAVAAALGVEALLLTAEAPQGADDLSAHPLAKDSPLPLLVRDLPGRWRD